MNNKRPRLIQTSTFRTKIKNLIEMYKTYHFVVKPVINYHLDKKDANKREIHGNPVNLDVAKKSLRFFADSYRVDSSYREKSENRVTFAD